MSNLPIILILNGPNLNMLGTREPEIYGSQTLGDIHIMCEAEAQAKGYAIDFRQSNHEGELVDWIQRASQNNAIHAVIINPAAYTHTSVAIHDALKLLSVPIVEVHLSDPQQREAFRHHSFVTPLAAQIISGQGAAGYTQAIAFLSTYTPPV